MHLLRLTQLLGLIARSPVILDARQAAIFDEYPGCAQDCLQNNAENTNCLSYATIDQQDACLCVDSSFLTASAQCIYTSCPYAYFEISASDAVSGCQTAGTPSVLTYQELLTAGESANSTTTTAGPVVPSATKAGSTQPSSTTTASTPQNTQGSTVIFNCGNGGNNATNGGNGNGGTTCVNGGGGGGKSSSSGLSQSDRIALGTGIGFGVPTVLIGILGLYKPQWLGPLCRARARAIARSDMVDIPRPSYA